MYCHFQDQTMDIIITSMFLPIPGSDYGPNNYQYFYQFQYLTMDIIITSMFYHFQDPKIKGYLTSRLQLK